MQNILAEENSLLVLDRKSQIRNEYHRSRFEHLDNSLRRTRITYPAFVSNGNYRVQCNAPCFASWGAGRNHPKNTSTDFLLAHIGFGVRLIDVWRPLSGLAGGSSVRLHWSRRNSTFCANHMYDLSVIQIPATTARNRYGIENPGACEWTRTTDLLNTNQSGIEMEICARLGDLLVTQIVIIQARVM